METAEPKPGSLAADLGALLESGEVSDVTLAVGSLRQRAHRAVLAARSPVFAAMFTHGMREASEGSVNITDMSEEVLQQLLTFVYTDKTPLLRTVAAELLVTAEKYNLPLLKEKCEEQLVQDMSVDNAASAAVLAIVHSCTKLKAEAMSFIKTHSLEVMVSDGWADVLRTNKQIAIDISRMVRASAANSETSAGQRSTQQSLERRGSLAGDMAALLESQEGCDIKLVVGDSQLPAHRAVLVARSSAFAAMLRETSDSCVKMQNVEEEVLKQVLLFLYTGQASPLQSTAAKLLVAADTYGLENLKKQCEHKIGETLTVDNVVKAAVLAVTHSCSSLETASVDFIRRHCVTVMGTDGWKTALQNHTEVAIQISSLVSAAAKTVPPPSRMVPEDKAKAMGATLLVAAKEGRVEKVRQLLDAGAVISARGSDKGTSLHLAARNGRETVVMCLLQAGADVNARNSQGYTPLHVAAWEGHIHVVQMLIAARTDINARDCSSRTPLHWASKAGQAEVVRVLLQAGADEGARDESRMTARDLALGNGRQAVLDILN